VVKAYEGSNSVKVGVSVVSVKEIINDIVLFSMGNKIFILVMSITNMILSFLLIQKIESITNKNITEAMGRRVIGKSLYKRCTFALKTYLQNYERRIEKAGFLAEAKEKVKVKAKKLGFEGENGVVSYLFVRYGISILIFITAFFINFPSFDEALKASVIALFITEVNFRKKEKELELSLQKYAYKIYKYLHNQISSGIKVTDAIKNVYEVINDNRLKNVLIRMAARYELTMDIDSALNEFRSVYDTHEAESFCVAIKQGILTGDNTELLARQEEIMFKKYFAYIQAETDSRKTRCLMAAVVFVAIIVIMILIPLIYDAAGALEKIFMG